VGHDLRLVHLGELVELPVFEVAASCSMRRRLSG
jgi:hypothetical protein